MLDLKSILGLITIALVLYGYYAYIFDTLKGKTKPHLFSWIVFLIMDIIAFLIQYGDNAGAGAWGTATTGFTTAFIVLLAIKYGEKHITSSDKISFILALGSIILYLTLDNPLYALLNVIAILIFAMYPTFRKSYSKPKEETLTLYSLAGLRNALGILATSNISILTIGLPVFIIIINTLFIAMVLIRRKQLK